MEKKRIAVFTAAPYKDYARNILDGMIKEAMTRDFSVYCFTVLSETDFEAQTPNFGEAAVFGLPDPDDFDGLVVMKSTIFDSLALRTLDEFIQRFGDKPIASLCFEMPGAYNLEFDEASGVAAQIEHFVKEHAATDIAYVTGPIGNMVAKKRLDSFIATMKKFNMTVDDSSIYYGNFMREDGEEAAKYFLYRNKPMPDAILCGNDDMALGLCETLCANGVRVPDDVGIAGEDCTLEALTHVPSMTSVRRPTKQIGKLIIKVLSDAFEGVECEKNHELKSRLVVNSSCGCGSGIGDRMNEYISFLVADRKEHIADKYRAVHFTTVMAGTRNYDELNDKLLLFANSWQLHRLYVCVNEGILTRTRSDCMDYMGRAGDKPVISELPDTMRLAFGYRDGESIQRNSFPSNRLLMQSELENSDYLMFCSLYSTNEIYGYIAFDVRDSSEFMFRIFPRILGGTIENISLHFTVQSYAKELERMYVRDSLTGLLNRRGYLQYAEELYDTAKRTGQPLMIISADLDRLKRINDTYGHSEGDEAIKALARCLQKTANSRDICVHMSGDEFIVVGIGYDEETMGQYMRSIHSEFERMSIASRKPYAMSVSLGGCSLIPDDNCTLEIITGIADNAMYKEKQKHHRDEL